MASTKTGSIDELLSILKDNKVYMVERVYDHRLQPDYVFKDIECINMRHMVLLVEGIKNGTTTSFVEFVYYPRKKEELNNGEPTDNG